jgi:hypothetical protein
MLALFDFLHASYTNGILKARKLFFSAKIYILELQLAEKYEYKIND